MLSYIIIGSFILSGIISFALMYVSILKNSVIKNSNYVFFNIHIVIFTMGCIMEIFSKDMNTLRTAVVIQYLGFPFVAPNFFMYVRKYINKPIKNKIVIGLLFIIPLISFFMVFVDEHFGLFFKEFVLMDYGNITSNKIKGTIFYYVLVVQMYVIYLATLVCSVRAYREANKNLKKTLSFLVTITAISLVIGIAFIFGFSPYGMDMSPISMTLANLYASYNIYFKNIFMAIPHTRSYALENMEDGYILIDESGSYLDSNEVAKNIFPSLKNAKVDTNIFNILNNKEIEILKENKINSIEVNIENEAGEKNDYKIKISTVTDRYGANIYSWIITNITEYKALRSDLEYMAKYDSLSEIYNKGTFFQIGNEKFNGNINGNSDFAVLMMDIDFFKKVNDSYGHSCGDYVIKEVANRISKNLRNTDVLARFGGEEYVIYLENVNQEALKVICDKLLKSISETKFVYNEISFEKTLSIGCSIYDKNKHKSFMDMIEEADKNLYVAKNSGRNQARLFSLMTIG